MVWIAGLWLASDIKFGHFMSEPWPWLEGRLIHVLGFYHFVHFFLDFLHMRIYYTNRGTVRVLIIIKVHRLVGWLILIEREGIMSWILQDGGDRRGWVCKVFKIGIKVNKRDTLGSRRKPGYRFCNLTGCVSWIGLIDWLNFITHQVTKKRLFVSSRKSKFTLQPKLVIRFYPIY